MFVDSWNKPHSCMQSGAFKTKRRAKKVVNLSLHGIGKPDRKLLSPNEEKWWLSPAVFESIMNVISEYKNISLSIDDGNISDVEIVLPALLKHNMKASFFIPVGMLGNPGYLRFKDVQHLSESGMLIGTHGMDHRNWRLLNDEELAGELFTSKDILERLTGQQVLQAAIPFGDYDRRVLQHLRRAGFERVYTSDNGTAKSHAWFQSRDTLQASDTPESVKAIIHQTSFGAKAFVRGIKKVIKRWR